MVTPYKEWKVPATRHATPGTFVHKISTAHLQTCYHRNFSHSNRRIYQWPRLHDLDARNLPQVAKSVSKQQPDKQNFHGNQQLQQYMNCWGRCLHLGPPQDINTDIREDIPVS
jgi:hypothetical protein